MKAKILWIEGKRADSPSFIPSLRKKDFLVETVQSGNAALEKALELQPDLVVVNAASLRTNGKRICRTLHEKINGIPIILITNPDQPVNSDICASITLSLPFTVRKLVNRIQPLLSEDGQQFLEVGPIRLDLDRKQVRCQGKEARLTPRLTKLLQIMMLHPGEVMERKQLFREIWKTEYTGDTRTLDVHVSWLRHAIEQDPRNPKLLKTIRRVGYRLDV